MIDINYLSKQALQIARSRNQEDCNAIKHLATEVLEVQDAYSRRNETDIAQELADVIINSLSIAAQFNIDIQQAIESKMIVNAKRIKHNTMLSTGRNAIDE